MVLAGSTDQRGWDDVIDFLARELHLAKADIHDDDIFSELGVDAILARSITRGLSKLLKVNISDAVFQSFVSVNALRGYLAEQAMSNQVVSATKEKLGAEKKAIPIARKQLPRRIKMPLSMVLQGNPASASQIIFLLPDGSGSAMAYAGIPRVEPSTCVVGLNSPFLGAAENYHCAIEETASKWVPEIRARQPHGPYILGGWSAGGYYSFEVAKQLMALGEAVTRLILLDSPCRTDFEALPMEVVRYLSASGRMGDWGSGPGKTPSWVTSHFEGTLRAVRSYMPTPLIVPAGLPIPQVFIVWCREGVWTSYPEEEARASGLDLNVNVTRFLLKGKPDFGTHSWEKLFPESEIAVSTMPGNHFTLISQPFVKTLAPLLRDAVMARGPEEREQVWQQF
ncbi:hypothetical protein N0V95_002039 [Ascochyta clinopodiicola]|nr:hypothetical protein N0V95_002039 [Ascochyta clinopodiicola]